MLITKETDYALRIFRVLSQGEYKTVGKMAEQEQLPHKFAYKIIKKLEKAGMVQITRGAGGGCSLACDLKTATLYDLIRAVETNAYLTACMTPEYICEWKESHEAVCLIHKQLASVQASINRELGKRSLYWILFGEDSVG